MLLEEARCCSAMRVLNGALISSSAYDHRCPPPLVWFLIGAYELRLAATDVRIPRAGAFYLGRMVKVGLRI